MKLRIICLSLILSAASFAWADDATREADANWPAWRGPTGNGIALSGNPPIEFSETQNVKWIYDFPGQGASTPIIWGDRLFLLTAIETEREAPKRPEPTAKPVRRRGPAIEPPSRYYRFDVLCIDRTNGELLWQKTAREEPPHEGHHADHGYASYSPVTDGERLYINYGSHGVYCLDFEGNKIWERDLGRMQTRLQFGEGTSPALHGDTLVVNFDHQGDSFVVALDKNTGETKWRQDRNESTSWSTPLIVEVDGKAQAVVSGTRLTRSYDLETGEILWQCGGQTINAIPSPVSGSGMVYITSGYLGSALQAIELGRTGDLTGTDAIRWSVDKATPYVPSPLLYEGKIYVLKGNTAILSCYNAEDGTPYYKTQRLNKLSGVYASPLGVAGRVYIAGRSGNVTVLDNSDELNVLAINTLDDRFDASPVSVGDDLYLRGHEKLYCFGAE